jgi:hypothetical protein
MFATCERFPWKALTDFMWYCKRHWKGILRRVGSDGILQTMLKVLTQATIVGMHDNKFKELVLMSISGERSLIVGWMKMKST